jgi:hypothetical protein
MKLDVDIDDVLYNKFHDAVTTPGGIWRRKNYKKETAQSAFQSAVGVALQEFLNAREKKQTDK